MPDELLRASNAARKRFFDAKKALLSDLVVNGQFPSTLLITCADSRITPDALFGLDPGDFFIMRNVANCVPPHSHDAAAVMSGIEYGVHVLNIAHIVVLGHTQCGGVMAVDDPPDPAQFPAVESWLNVIRPAQAKIDAQDTEMDSAERHTAIVQQHVRNQLANLNTYDYIREKVEAGTLNLHGWVYHLEDPGIRYLDVETDTFIADA